MAMVHRVAKSWTRLKRLSTTLATYQILLFYKYFSNPHDNLDKPLDCRIEIKPHLETLDDWSRKKMTNVVL